VHVAQQQRARVAVAESVDEQLGESGEDVLAAFRARREYDCDPFSEEAAGDKTEDLSRGLVEPLRVLDDAPQGSLLGDLGEKRQRRQSDQEPVRRGA
jgi:hypothetical protein